MPAVDQDRNALPADWSTTPADCGCKRVAQGATLLAALIAALLLWPTRSAPELVAGSVFVGTGACISVPPENASAPLGAFGKPVGWSSSVVNLVALERAGCNSHCSSYYDDDSYYLQRRSYDDFPDVASCALACQEAEEDCTGFRYAVQSPDTISERRECYLVAQTVALWSSYESSDSEGRRRSVCYAKGHDAQIASMTRGEALFAVTNALPTLCALATLLVFAIRDHQDAAGRARGRGVAVSHRGGTQQRLAPDLGREGGQLVHVRHELRGGDNLGDGRPHHLDGGEVRRRRGA